MIDRQAYFFDMDGVLFDSMPHHAIAWEQAMQAHGLPFTQHEVYLNEGRTGHSVIREAISTYCQRTPTAEEVDAIYADKCAAFARLGEARPVADVARVLQYLQSHQREIWIVTGSGQQSLFDRLDSIFPTIFSRQRMITAYDVQRGKPDPEPYLAAWQKTGLRKDQCCVIENAPLGVRSGRAAGLYTIAVNTGPLPDEVLLRAGADHLCHNMSELLQFIS